MDDTNAMPPVLEYGSWRPPEITVRRQVWLAVYGAAVGGLAGFALIFVAAIAAGAGHGSYAPAKLLFPLSMALTGITGTISEPLVIMAMAQCPAYGLFIGWLTARRRRRLAWTVLGVVHACAAASAMIFPASTFSP